MGTIRILFVCLGNICRSPAAEGAFKAEVLNQNLDTQFFIDSAGTEGYHTGELPNLNTRKVARESGIELTHRARKFQAKDFLEFDYIFAMDESNYNNLQAMAQSESDQGKIYKFRQFDPLKQGDHIPDVPDPYYGSYSGFQEVQSIVERTAPSILKWILKQQNKS